MGRWAQRQRGRGAGPQTVRPTRVIGAVHNADGAIFTFDQQVEATAAAGEGTFTIDGNMIDEALQIDAYTVHFKTLQATDPGDQWDISATPAQVIPAAGSEPIDVPQSGLLT